MEPLQLSPTWFVRPDELSVRFVRSGGPGGQNVNKVATKVELRFFLSASSALSEGQKARFREIYPSSLTRAGHCVLFCDEHRSQIANLAAVRARLRAMILRVQRPPLVRRPTRPSLGEKRKRLFEKKKRAEVKRLRKLPFE